MPRLLFFYLFKRIGLSMRLDAAPARREGGAGRENRFEPARGQRQQRAPEAPSAMASAFAKLQGLGKR